MEQLLYQQELPPQKQLIHSFADTLSGLVASHLIPSRPSSFSSASKKHDILTHFRRLVSEKFWKIKHLKDNWRKSYM